MNTQHIIEIERAINELRRGLPVTISGYTYWVAETLTPKQWDELKGSGALLLPHPRARMLGLDVPENQPLMMQTDALDFATMQDWVFALKAPAEAKPIALNADLPMHEPAIKLAVFAERLPTLLVAPKTEGLAVSEEAIENYENDIAIQLEPVAESPLTLKDAENARIVAFRAAGSGQEHFAICVGDLASVENPVVRIHSSCYTGDLLGSLACDCGDQLHEALRAMDEAGGGVVVYLMQEGRGIGLVNKLRAYAAKDTGLDTLDANRVLGFEDDSRPYALAAEMLKHLNVKNVRLLTNNPRKVKGLEAYGFTVERADHQVEAHELTQDYIDTKFNRMGYVSS